MSDDALGDDELPTDEQLIAWHSEDVTGLELAEREGLEVRWIYRQWDRLRRDGALARGARTVGKPASASAPHGSHDIDGRPRVGWYGDDALLSRLIEVHGAGGRADLVDLVGRKSSDVAAGGRRA